MLKVGDKVPVFSLMDTERNEFTNANIDGKITLFLFFPAAFTSTCTAELCSVRDDISRYQNINMQVFGISTDALFTLKKYKEEEQLNFELLSDFNKDVSRAFDSLYEVFKYNMKGVSKRSAIIIDEKGIIQYIEVLENASHIPNFNLINQKLEELSTKLI